jgi:hypothetical protein
MMDQFVHDVPDFDFDRFDDWIGQIWYEEDAGLLLRAPLCTPAVGSVLTSKVVCVAGDEMLVPAEPPAPVTKDKEEEDQADVDVPSAPPMDSSPVTEAQMREVQFANEHVPVVGKEGTKLPPKNALKEKAKRTVVHTCKHAKKYHAESGDLLSCPCSWIPPAQGKGESTADYQVRLTEFNKARSGKARKLNIRL